MKSTTTTFYKGFPIDENENTNEIINNLAEEKKKTMGKLDALFILESGYINIVSGIYIYKSNTGIFLQVAAFPGLLKGGNFKIKATTPEDAKKEINGILSELYGASLADLLTEINNI